ncbi:MAG: hypothetical protein HRT61_24725 [Ekhidna sp.]|nr:hypothetical protein [Ekhidna sp.]
MGNFDASSGTPPTQPASGSAVYRVDVAGTINNMTLSENDVLYYDQVEDAGETSWRSVGGKSYSIQDGELSQKNFTTEKDDKLTDIAENANNYSHPDNHAASMITQDATHRFASDTEKTAWNTAPTPSGIGALALTGGNVVGATKVTAGTTELDVSTTGVKVTGVFEINNVDILARIAEVEVLTLAAMALAGG